MPEDNDEANEAFEVKKFIKYIYKSFKLIIYTFFVIKKLIK